MKLSKLYERHQKYQNEGLSGSFGDGYLCANNPLYRRVRELALEMDYSFSNERNDLYETFPLLYLEPLLKSKKIPYSNNAALFSLLSRPQLENLSWQDIDGNLKRNFVFHEAAHGIAREITLQTLGECPRGPELPCLRRRALHLLLEESFANCCELLGAIYAQDPVHRIFYEMNSYICEFEHRTNLKNAMAELGSEVISKMMLLAYLQANFLRQQFDEKSFKDMLSLVAEGTLDSRLNLNNKKILRSLAKISFNLSERFRMQTTSFYFRQIGIKTPLQELLDFDFIQLMAAESPFRNFLQKFGKIIQ